MVEVPEKVLQSLRRKAAILDELEEKISKHQGTYNEKTDEFEDNEDCTLDSIGEIVLDHLDMWR